MNVLCLSWFDNGNQLQLLSEALREYTEYEALHINAVKTAPMLHDSDIWLAEYQDAAKLAELKLRIKNADFFIFSEFLPTSNEMGQVINALDIKNRITPNNTIVRTGGSVTKYNAEKYLVEGIKYGWLYAGGAHDFSIASKIGCIAPTRNICPIDKLPKPNPPKGKVRVCFAPTKDVKGVKPVTRVMDRITKEYGDDAVEFVPIQNKTWKESILLKSTCNVTFDQFWISTYANSAIESMYLKHAVLSRIDRWTQMMYPDLPIINTPTEEHLYQGLKGLLDQPDLIETQGELGRKFVLANHTPELVANQWKQLIAFVAEGRSARMEISK